MTASFASFAGEAEFGAKYDEPVVVPPVVGGSVLDDEQEARL